MMLLMTGVIAIIIIEAKAADQCDPRPYFDKKNTRYCTQRRDGWTNGGVYNAIENACTRFSSGCQCTCKTDISHLGHCKSSYFSDDAFCYVDSAACPPCDAGSERKDCGCDLNTHECSEGSCSSCGKNMYSIGGLTNCTACTQCKQGFYFSRSCFSGTSYNPGYDAILEPCPAGSFCSVSSCENPPVLCPIGSYCPVGSVQSKTCDALQAQLCPNSGMSLYNTGCHSGFMFRSSPLCSPCPSGSYMLHDAHQLTACTLCSAGSFSIIEGASVCQLCLPGTSSVEVGKSASTCSNCIPGSYQTGSGFTTCIACAAGSYVGYRGAMYVAECLLCSAGTYTSIQGTITCASCMGGSYSSQQGATACTVCPNGTTTTAIDSNANSIVQCQPCPAGDYTCPCLADNTQNECAQKLCRPFITSSAPIFYQKCVHCIAEDTTTLQNLTSYFCPGDGFFYARQRPVLGNSFLQQLGTPSTDNSLTECKKCAIDNEFMQTACTLTADTVCRKCSTAKVLQTYVALTCNATSNAILKICNASMGHMEEGGLCNRCPAGSIRTRLRNQSSGFSCVLCPVNQYKPFLSNDNNEESCLPCPDGTVSAGGAARCTVDCSTSSSFAYDGVNCLVNGDSTMQQRTIAWWDSSHLKTIATGLQLSDGTFIAVQNFAWGGIIWHLGQGSAWLAAGSFSASSFTTSMTTDDGVGAAASFGYIAGLAASATDPSLLVVLDKKNNIGIRILRYDSAWGFFNVSTPISINMVVPVAISAKIKLDTTARLVVPSAIVTLGSSSSSNIFLVADQGTHSIWKLSSSPISSLLMWNAVLWRGGQMATSTFSSSSAQIPSTSVLSFSGGQEWRLAQPYSLAVLEIDDDSSGNSILVLSSDVGVSTVMGFVLDARAVWAFDAVSTSSTQTATDLIYVCGGGTHVFKSIDRAVACSELDLQGTGVMSITAGYAGGGPVVFMSFISPPSSEEGFSGILIFALQHQVFAIMVRLLTSSQSQLQFVTGGLFFGNGGAGGGRRLFGTEGGRQGQIVEYAIAAIQASFFPENNINGGGSSSSMACICDAGLYCSNHNNNQCVPSPVGTFSPSWSPVPIKCPAGSISGGPEGKDVSWCGRCASADYTTFYAGSLACVPICLQTGFFFSTVLGKCVDGCNLTSGEFMQFSTNDNNEDGMMMVCAQCPLGTQTVGDGCIPCKPGTFGSSKGVCTPCSNISSHEKPASPLVLWTVFEGATLCTATAVSEANHGNNNASSNSNNNVCSAVIYSPFINNNNNTNYRDDDIINHVHTCAADGPLLLMLLDNNNNDNHNNTNSNLGLLSALCSNNNNNNSNGHQIIKTLLATSDGTVYVSTETCLFSIDPFTKDTTFLASMPASFPYPFFDLVEMMEEDHPQLSFFYAKKGSSCIWRLNINTTTNLAAQNTGLLVGDCNRAGNMDGMAAVALFGSIFSLALMHVESYSPVLFVSTTYAGCASIRAVSLYDASVTTLVSSDALHLPKILLNACPSSSTPFIMSIARGTDELYYAVLSVEGEGYGSVGRGNVWLVQVLNLADDIGQQQLEFSLNTNDNVQENIIGLCSRGLSGNNDSPDGMLIVLSSSLSGDPINEKKRSIKMRILPSASSSSSSGSSSILTLESDSDFFMNQVGIVCAGRRVWYADSQRGVIEQALPFSFVSGCMGGFVSVQGADTSIVCTQVGVGQYTSTIITTVDLASLSKRRIAEANVVRVCKAGTYGISAGGASHLVCKACPAGYISKESAQMCTPCPPNKPISWQGTCVNHCPAGSYFFVSGTNMAAECRACPSGSSSPANALSITECVACPAGFFANLSTLSFSTCQACPEGWTSNAGSYKCIRICDQGTCAADGENCKPLTKDWEVVTSIMIRGGNIMRAVAVSPGGGVFYTEGTSLMYFLDDCPAHVTLSDVDACMRYGVDLLNLATPSPQAQRDGAAAAITRGFSALAISETFCFSLSTASHQGGAGIRLLYVSSTITHSVYRLPILYTSSGVVDVENTQKLLGSSASAVSLPWLGLHALATFALPSFFAANSLLPSPDNLVVTIMSVLSWTVADSDYSGIETWRLFGSSRGTPGYADGSFDTVRLNTPSELELSSDGSFLVFSDYMNQRIRVANLTQRIVTTLVGTGAACWNYGVTNTPLECGGGSSAFVASCNALNSQGKRCSSAYQPLGVGLSRSISDQRLYVAMFAQNSVGVVTQPLKESGDFSHFCSLLYTNAANQNLPESCLRDSRSRTCMLNRPFDALVSETGDIFVAVSNGVTRIDPNTLQCQQIAGYWWSFSSGSQGFQDGSIDQGSNKPTSLVNQPFKLAADHIRGILYIADLNNAALRRIFIDGKCRCPEGSIFVPQAQACYNPTQAWDTGLLLKTCPSGQFALEGDTACRLCTEASIYGLAAAACTLWAAQQRQSHAVAASGGFTYARISAVPQPLGGIAADWYGIGPLPPSPSWDDIFRIDSPVHYMLGTTPGRAPWGGEYVSYTFDTATGKWSLELDPAFQPVLLLPGLWYPCSSSIVTTATEISCQCTTVVAAFKDHPSSSGISSDGVTTARWHELRLAAFEGGARVLGNENMNINRLKYFAGAVPPPQEKGNDNNPAIDESVKVKPWSRFMILGTADDGGSSSSSNRLCAGRGMKNGPCFPVMKHVQVVPDVDTTITTAYIPLTLSLEGGGITTTMCATGWPAHYACPNGYVWVGPNTFSFFGDLASSNTNYEVEQAHHHHQIACLSCVPGSFSLLSAEQRKATGGPYQCEPCILGTYASSVGSTSCLPCPSGTYADTLGASACLDCPLNHWTFEGAQTSTACSPCAPGIFLFFVAKIIWLYIILFVFLKELEAARIVYLGNGRTRQPKMNARHVLLALFQMDQIKPHADHVLHRHISHWQAWHPVSHVLSHFTLLLLFQ